VYDLYFSLLTSDGRLLSNVEQASKNFIDTFRNSNVVKDLPDSVFLPPKDSSIVREGLKTLRLLDKIIEDYEDVGY
jgi:hypothetical protein